MYDLMIIGSGPAGISAALTAKARNLNFIWFGSRALSTKIEKAEKIMNYPGLPAVTGSEMQSVFLKQIDDCGITITESQVNSIYDCGGYFAAGADNEIYEAKAVIMTVGMTTTREIEGEARLLGCGVSYCATCDGALYKNKECHTALRQIQRTFNGARWFIEGDIKGFFDNIDHGVMISILEKRISDERFLRLIRKFLNAGYLEDWTYHKTYSGTPQGGIISPMLANIYLDQLDRYVHEYIQRFDKGKERADNSERIKFEYGKRLAVLKLEKIKDKEQRKSIVKEIKAYDKGRAAIPCGVDMDENFRRLKYVRYADDFLCAVIGTKAEAEAIKQDIKVFLQEKLALELSEEKTLITHGRKSAKFLGYEIYVRKSTQTKRNKAGKLTRPYNNKIYLKMPLETVRKKLLDYDALQINVHNGKEQYKSKHRTYLINNDDLEILERYNSEIRGFYNYYSLANNCHTLHSFKYIMEYSMYKTFAAKYKSTVVKICKKYKKDKVFTVYYKNNKGKTLTRQFYHDGFKRKKQDYAQCYDKMPERYYFTPTSLVARLKACRCELCGKENVKLDMHHVRKLKNLQGKEDWEKHMIARKRKTIALCRSCHKKVDGGWMD